MAKSSWSMHLQSTDGDPASTIKQRFTFTSILTLTYLCFWKYVRFSTPLMYCFGGVLYNYSFSLQATKASLNKIFCRLCSYPQHITLQLLERSRIRKLQLLAHQYLIPGKVEFHIGDSIPESSSPGFLGQLRRLG